MNEVWAWLSRVDPNGLLAPGGVVGAVVMYWVAHRKPQTGTDAEQTAALKTVAASPADREALALGREALRTVAAMTDDMEALRADVSMARTEAEEAKSEALAVRGENTKLWAWILDVRGNWHRLRLELSPPPEPDID